LLRTPRGAPSSDRELQGLLGQLVQQLQRDTGRHFEFEENELFPRLADAGDRDIVLLLGEEHEALRALATELLPLAQAAATGTLDTAAWQDLRRAVLELVERQVAHVQKETMALLPLLDDLLDDETDRQLAMAYAAQ
jgi:hemerythrin-like domain-containing protein